MSNLPVISGKECIKVLQQIGFQLKRQKGSHITLRRDIPFGQVVVPNHKELDRGTLRNIIRQANISVDEFTNILRNI